MEPLSLLRPLSVQRWSGEKPSIFMARFMFMATMMITQVMVIMRSIAITTVMTIILSMIIMKNIQSVRRKPNAVSALITRSMKIMTTMIITTTTTTTITPVIVVTRPSVPLGLS